jgi:ATP-dependent Lon protease
MITQNNLEPGFDIWQRKIALPVALVNLLEQERRAAEEQTEAAERLAEEREDLTGKSEALQLRVEDWPLDMLRGIEPCLKLLDKNQVEEAAGALNSFAGDEDKRSRARSLIKALRSVGEYRKLQCLPYDWRRILDRLERRFPNFLEVINYFRSMFALAERNGRSISFSPVLLAGPPGVGKSYFAEAFAEAFSIYKVCLRMENAQTNAGLAGSAEFWSNTQPGAIFDALVLRTHANPFFLLDEVDKVTEDGRYNPLSPLLTLLEPGTAESFQDLSFPWLTLDASRVLWICTANDSSQLSAPLRSRLKIFEIPLLTMTQSRRLAIRIFGEIRREFFGTEKSITLDPAALDAVAAVEPREMRRILLHCVGWVLFRSRQKILANDVESAANSPQKSTSIGFTTSL